ncbi:transposase, partial [Nonomuraea sp. NPDC049637]|uniref:transposase n=1 Tax=Nonomuraea sp. NPDC049637 TaxID=3154356 RepID=UPI00341C871E
PYPSDLSDAQWALIEPVLTAWKAAHPSLSGHEGGYELREIVNAFEAYGGVSFSARTVVLGSRGTVTTRHGLVLIAQPTGSSSHGVDRFVVPGVADVSAVNTSLRHLGAPQQAGRRTARRGTSCR